MSGTPHRRGPLTDLVRHPRSALAGALVVVTACLPGALPPAVPARSALSLGGTIPTPASTAGPLAVVFAAPRGETTQAGEIAVVFNKPMRALGLGPSDPTPPIALRPAAKGAFHWVGSAALRFDAEEPLAPATTYHVEIPAGTRALDGSTLAEAFAFELTTPRARVVETWPEQGDKDLPPDTAITLGFAQPVSDVEIARAVTIHGERVTAPVPFTIHRRGPARVELAPARPLPLADRVHVRVDASLRADGGELPAGRDHELVFTTVGPPSVRAWTCEPHPDDAGACDPDDPVVMLELTGAVPRAALARAVVIEPSVTWDRADDSDDPTNDLPITASWKPGTTYRVHLAPNAKLVDWTGQRLAPDAGRTLRFGHRPARVALGLRGTYWSTRARHEFAAWATNVTGAELRLAPRAPDAILRELGGAPQPQPAGPTLTLAEPPLDAAEKRAVAIDQLLPGARGVIDLVATFTPREGGARRSTTQPIQITDLGLTARLGHGSAAVLVTDLEDARPAAGVEVALYRAPAERLAVATTGPRGEATLAFTAPLGDKDQLAFVARRGSDWTLHPIKPPRAAEAIGVVYTERGIYRPGEAVKLSGIMRVPGVQMLQTPNGGPVHVAIRGPGRAPVIELDTTLSAFGTFAIDVPIPKDAPVGHYGATVTAAGGRAHGGFRVAEYRPTEIAVDASTDHATYARGETLRCSVKARYLHGGPMAGAKATVVVSRSPSNFTVPGLDGFTTYDSERAIISAEIARTRAPLDQRGAYTLAVPLALPGQTNSEQVSCAVEAMDLNRQALSASTSAVVHPAELYVALESPSASVVEPGASLSAAALAVTPEGARRPAKVHLEIVRREGEDGAPKDTPVATCDVQTGPAPARCAYTVPRGSPDGARILVRGSVVDEKGNRARASYALTVQTPPKPAPRAPSPPPAAPMRVLRLATDRAYKVGQTAHVTIESPFSALATALVTVEREGLLWQRIVPVPTTGASLDFPVTEAMIPNAYVSAMLVSGREARRTDASFEVDPAPKELAVTVDAGGEAHRPSEAIDVEVQVKDVAGRPTRAEVTLWAADEGSLSLIGYDRPDPHRWLHDWRSALVTEAESRDDLVKVGLWGSHRSRPPTVRMGATQVSPPRGDFRQTAFFAAHLVTDDGGRLRRRFTLPDGLTSYRVMAVAVAADDRFGSAQTNVVTSLPLMARATLPRVIRAGDRFEASVVVSGKDAAGDVAVSAEATGVTLASTRRTLHLEPSTPADARFTVRADRPGPMRFSARATTGALGDAMTLTRDVVTPLVPETASIEGETSSAAAEQLGDLASIHPHYGGLDLTLSTTPLAGLADGIEQLVEYPYGCTEQTVSRLVPLLALRDLAASLGVSLPGEARRKVDEAVARLVAHQRRDGGFGLWRESGRSTPWLTAWALWGLGEARRRGASVPAGVEARARGYLHEAIFGDGDLGPDRLALAAFSADLAALDGRPDRDLTARLVAARDRLPPFARALLLHALALAKDEPTRLRDLARDLENTVRIDGAAARVVVESRFTEMLDSDTRTTAMLLRVLVAVDPAHPLVPRLARGLLDARRGGRFRTTHEAAWALLALDDLRRARPAPASNVEARVFLGDALLHEVALRDAKPIAFGIPAASLLAASGRPLAFTADGPLHYRATLRFARRELPTQPVESGFFLRRTARPLDDFAKPGDTFGAGDLVLVQLDVATPSPRSAVVLESPLPGGFEPADADLRLGGAWLRDLERTPATRRELRDDRVLYFVDDLPAGLTTFRYVARASTPGTFVTPPARVEEMYAPDTFARTAAETTTIVAR